MALEKYRDPWEPTGKMIRLVLVHQRGHLSSNSMVLRHSEFLLSDIMTVYKVL